MARTIIVTSGDTLSKIAAAAYGSPEFAARLASYNGITNPDLLFVGERLALPARKELDAGGQGTAVLSSTITPPHGLDAVIATFGNISAYIDEAGQLAPQWAAEHLAAVVIPFALPLSWDRTQQVSRIYCHKLLSGVMHDVFAAIEQRGLRSALNSYGGCFNYRSKRQSSKLSCHSWGIAIDLNPETNPMGKQGTMTPELVTLFKEYGFVWGGDWRGSGCDPMHFQYCSGY